MSSVVRQTSKRSPELPSLVEQAEEEHVQSIAAVAALQQGFLEGGWSSFPTAGRGGGGIAEGRRARFPGKRLVQYSPREGGGERKGSEGRFAGFPQKRLVQYSPRSWGEGGWGGLGGEGGRFVCVADPVSAHFFGVLHSEIRKGFLTLIPRLPTHPPTHYLSPTYHHSPTRIEAASCVLLTESNYVLRIYKDRLGMSTDTAKSVEFSQA